MFVHCMITLKHHQVTPTTFGQKTTLLSQCQTFKLLSIIFLVGKVMFKLLFYGPLAEREFTCQDRSRRRLSSAGYLSHGNTCEMRMDPTETYGTSNCRMVEVVALAPLLVPGRRLNLRELQPDDDGNMFVTFTSHLRFRNSSPSYTSMPGAPLETVHTDQTDELKESQVWSAKELVLSLKLSGFHGFWYLTSVNDVNECRESKCFHVFPQSDIG